MSDTIKSNMDIEGTRNERVGILLAAYIIGFVTAYIAFGVVQLEKPVQFTQTLPHNMASVIASRQSSGNVEAFLAVDKEGLVLIKGNERTLLSAIGDSSQTEFFTDGEHVSILDYSLSPDQENVYFCELPSVDSDSCRPYIYSLADDLVYPVMVNGERVAFSAEEYTASWNDDGELIVN